MKTMNKKLAKTLGLCAILAICFGTANAQSSNGSVNPHTGQLNQKTDSTTYSDSTSKSGSTVQKSSSSQAPTSVDKTSVNKKTTTTKRLSSNKGTSSSNTKVSKDATIKKTEKKVKVSDGMSASRNASSTSDGGH